MNRRYWLSLLLAILAVVGVGCGGPKLAEVEGIVLVDGQPQAGVTVEFQPEQGSPSFGETDATGRYELRFSRHEKGAEIGKHVVRISKDFDADENSPRVAGVKTVIPPQFNDETQLASEVQAGENKLDFSVTSLRTAVRANVPIRSMSE